MKLLSEVEKDVMELSSEDCRKLQQALTRRLDSETSPLDPATVEECRRLSREMDEDPSKSLSHEEMKAKWGWS